MRWHAVRAVEDIPDALRVFAAAPDVDRFFWQRGDEAIAALGCVHAIELHDAARFADAKRAHRALLERVTMGSAAPVDVEAGPLLVGGFAFEPCDPGSSDWNGFPAGRLVLPEVMVRSRGEQRWMACVARDGAEAAARLEALLARTQPGSRSDPHAPPEYRAQADRPHAHFRDQVEEALDAIARGDLEKVVLARSVRVERRDPFSVPALLDTLRHAHPSCHTFAVARGSRVLLGASPERLVRLRGRRLETAAVAASAPRGRSPDEDAARGHALLESKKEQSEHAVVVRAIQAALADVCSALRVPEAPRLLRTEGIQHLESRIRGTLRENQSILDLIARLHPTPAVGGAPRDAALGWLRQHERLERGWYAGPIGFVDRAGGGEFWVALRAALIRGGEAALYAGAGIVAGSEPDAELRETRLKLRALLSPLLEI